jgi:uncharacterized protein YodC (DUF2158 family)
MVVSFKVGDAVTVKTMGGARPSAALSRPELLKLV